MIPRLPSLTGREVIAILGKHGLIKVRQSGSHVIMKHADGRRTTVPLHASRDVGRGLLRQIMRDAKLTPDDMSD